MAIATGQPPVFTLTSSVIEVVNPRTGESLYSVPEATADEIQAAYARARAASPVLAGMSVRQRLDELNKIQRYVLRYREDIVQRIVNETGKPRTEAMLTEVFPTLDLIRHYAKTAEKVLRDQRVPTPLILAGKKSRIYYEPLGTVLIISPWNYPFNLSMCPIVTALAAGNAVVFKPSEYTPLRGLVEEIFERSGFVKDAVQVVYGGKEVGARLIDELPDKIFFTGSEAGGKAVMRKAAGHLIPVELELGGKDPMIVFDDVNVNRAVNGAIWGALTNSGQTCTSVERIYVQEGLYDEFLRQFKKDVQLLTNPLTQRAHFDDRSLDMGCMTTDFQIDKVEEQVRDAVEKGATLECGGKRVEGRVFPPTIISNVRPAMHIYHEESFGPITTIMPFKTEEDAIRLANDSPFGLSSSVWSADLERADRVARKLVTGNVSINNVLTTQGNAALPFGGVKRSGMGRYKGAHGLYSFSNIKSVMFDRNSGRYEPIWYPYTAKKYTLISKLVQNSFTPGIWAFLKTILTGLRLQLMAGKRHL